MFQRRVLEHLRMQNWFAFMLEFLIVVIGVFMGLQVQEWNQQREDRNQERAYLERLLVDFSTIEQDLKQCLSVYSDSVDAINWISKVVDSEVASDPASIEDSDAFSKALVRMTAGAIPTGRSATFVEMLSTGELSILRDPKLRDSLIAYDERAQSNRELWRALREEAIGYGRPLYDNIRLSVDLDKKRISSVTEYDLNAMSQDAGFRSMLNVLSGNKGNNYELCQFQLGSAQVVQDLLGRKN